MTIHSGQRVKEGWLKKGGIKAVQQHLSCAQLSFISGRLIGKEWDEKREQERGGGRQKRDGDETTTHA